MSDHAEIIRARLQRDLESRDRTSKRFPSGLLETYGRYAIRRTCGRTCQTKQAA